MIKRGLMHGSTSQRTDASRLRKPVVSDPDQASALSQRQTRP
ncbi:hypothetical protein SynPROS91_01984 [Synechococcus sp. PROS-9-1]|nr:hypothetical protein SynPROS91_01984 [Synechococcus sp. PROS-9-1]